MAPQVQATSIIGEPQAYEEKNVHAIYDEIAPHFSSTRYKPWPIIATFISSLPVGWIGLDSGTGNGKYLPLPLDRPGAICTVGLDRSRNLLNIAKTAGNTGTIRDVILGDILGRSWRVAAFDYAISIATIHHLATHERRKTAVKRLIEAVSPSHGRVLIYVWAIEQDALSKRSIPIDGAASTRGQDVVVPWVLSRQDNGSKDIQASTEPQVLNRYYHMFAKGELAGLVQDAASELGLRLGPPLGLGEVPISISRGVEMVQDGWERSNYYVELRCWELP